MRGKPFLLCEYVHAMGNGPGAIAQYEELVEQSAVARRLRVGMA